MREDEGGPAHDESFKESNAYVIHESIDAVALSRLRARLQFHRRTGRWKYTDAARTRIDEWKRGGRSAAAIALALQ